MIAFLGGEVSFVNYCFSFLLVEIVSCICTWEFIKTSC